MVITSEVQDKDILFKGDDGGSSITALTLDMSAAGEAKFNDNIVMGTAGKGVYLGVTSATASNLLDDYEEGTWSPSHETGAGSGSFSDAKYTKIGRLVHIVFTFTFSSGSGIMEIGSLPFTANSHSIGIGKEDNNNGYTVGGDLGDNNTVIRLLGTQAIGDPTAYQVAAGRIRFSMTYFTD